MTASILTKMIADDTITSTPSTEYTIDVFQDGVILMKMVIVRPKEYYGKKYQSGLVKGKQARSEPTRACDCFGNLGGHATWDSKLQGVTYACKVLGYNKRESIFVGLLGSVKKITDRYLFLPATQTTGSLQKKLCRCPTLLERSWMGSTSSTGGTSIWHSDRFHIYLNKQFV